MPSACGAYSCAMRTFADRFEEALKRRSLTKAELARRIGVSKQAVGEWASGKTKNVRPDNLVEAAKLLGVRVEWLAVGDLPMERHPLWVDPPPSSSNDYRLASTDFSMVPRYDVRASAGPGAEAGIELVEDHLAFRGSWLRSKGLSPKNLTAIHASGDSMEPRIRNGDVLLIDTSAREITDGMVYALNYDGGIRVKRLYRRIDGTLVIHSDNPTYTPREELVTPDMMEAIEPRIIGRVVWSGGDV